MIMVCPECSTPFNRYPGLVARAKISFCSRKCLHIHNLLTEDDKKNRYSQKKKEWSVNNPEKTKQYKKKYYDKNKSKCHKLTRDWERKNKEHVNKVNRLRSKDDIHTLSDSYINHRLKRQTGLKKRDIPQALVELKREQLKLHRLIRERQ